MDAHYALGNYYQWNTVTAGTGGSIVTGTAASSICSKGWRLPTSAEYTTLVTTLGGTSSTNNITRTPFYGVRGGIVYQTTSLFSAAGNGGGYWSSTPGANSGNAYTLFFDGTTNLGVSGSSLRQGGLSVRCIAR